VQHNLLWLYWRGVVTRLQKVFFPQAHHRPSTAQHHHHQQHILCCTYPSFFKWCAVIG
jgi:hypothetical protein